MYKEDTFFENLLNPNLKSFRINTVGSFRLLQSSSLWVFCAVTWWFTAHMLTVLLPLRIWISFGDAVVLGIAIGLMAFWCVNEEFVGLSNVGKSRSDRFFFYLLLFIGLTGGLWCQGHSPYDRVGLDKTLLYSILGLFAVIGMFWTIFRYGRKPMVLFKLMVAIVGVNFILTGGALFW